MRSITTRAALLLSCLSLASVVPQLLARKKDHPLDTSSEQKRAAHAVNRLTFGPRPGDVQQVMAIGVDRWIDLELHPEKIADDNLQSRLTGLRTLHMSTKEIFEGFPDNQMVKQVADGKRPMPSDPARRAVYQAQIARLEERQERKERKIAATPQPSVPVEATAGESAKTAEEVARNPDPASSDSNSMNAMGPGSTNMSTNAGADDNLSKPTPRLTAEEEAEARRREDSRAWRYPRQS